MSPNPSSLAGLFPLLAALMLQAVPGHVSADLQGEIRFEAQRAGPSWLGQEIELYLDLWSDGLSFGDQSFLLPEVRGAYLLQADSSTVKLNENRAGVQWQGLRYTFLLYPQRAGRLQVPPFEVRFSARAAYGSEPAAFKFDTPAILIDARLPPGADSSGLVVTTASFTMNASWTPPLPEDSPGDLQVGDAITLEVTRRARDVPGMVFAPLPDFSIDGLGVYPDPAQVNDRINRGSLTGDRTDSVTFVCEREGQFEIPALRFQWWDPEQEVLSEKVVPARELNVSAHPAYAKSAAAGSRNAGDWFSWKPVTMVVLGVFLLLIPGRRLLRVAAGRLRRWREDREAGEPWAFRQVLKACAADSAPASYNALTVWLSRVDRPRAGVTLMELAVASGDGKLVREVTALQESVASGSAGEWSGGKLARSLVKLRKQFEKTAQAAQLLHPLNPPPVRPR